MKISLPFRRALVILIMASTIVRAVLAFILELGNDEVYYWTYALYPDWSHFDHPPMVGWTIQFFTLNLMFTGEFFLRLGPVILGAFNTYMIFLIGRLLKDDLAGWYAALLYNASIYCFILSGVFILPDTPQLFFWLLSIWFFMKALSNEGMTRQNKIFMILAGAATGFGMLSKYTSVFLWFGVMIYIFIYDRRWLRSASLYLAILISIVLFLPVIIWNIRNDFISFTFQTSRVGFFESGVHPDLFLTELAGQVLYNNPVVVALIIIALIAAMRRKFQLPLPGTLKLLLFWSLPLIFLFLFISFFRSTLPHWTGPAYTTLILVAAAYLSGHIQKRNKLVLMPAAIRVASGLLLLVIVIGTGQINGGWFYNGSETDITQRGSRDISLDMFGWRQVEKDFAKVEKEDIQSGSMQAHAPIFSYRWFPSANIDYYVARKTGTLVLALGPLERIHKYAWINKERGGIQKGMDGWFITTSRDYADPREVFKDQFEQVIPRDTIPITRGGKIAEYGFIFQLRGLK
jgi:hypothetical protein